MNKVKAAPKPNRARRFDQPRVFLAVSFVFTAAIYSNSWFAAFVYDDIPSLVESHLGAPSSVWPHPENITTLSGRPVLTATFALNYAISSLHLWSYHAFNLLIHLGAGWLLYFILRSTLLRAENAPGLRRHAGMISGLIALGWLAHPLQTNAVTYIVQRAESLMALFYLAALASFIRAATSPRAKFWQVVSVGACALGMATKEVMVSAPVVIFFYDRAFLSGSLAAAWRARRGYYISLGLTWLILALLVISLGGNRGGTTGGLSGQAPWLAYWQSQVGALALYVKLTVWPHPLILNYTLRWGEVSALWWQVPVVACVAVAAVYIWRQWPRLGFLLGAFLAILAPTTIVPGTIELVAEHRMYLALAPLLSAIALGIYYISSRWWAYIMLVVVLIWGGITWQRNLSYSSARAIYLDSNVKSPGNFRILALLAEGFRAEGNLAQAEDYLRQAVRFSPTAPLLNNLGQVCGERGERREAVESFGAALALDETNLASLTNLGNALMQSGDSHGLMYLARAVLLNPRNPTCRENVINALRQTGNLANARDEAVQATKELPQNDELWALLGAILIQQGNFTEAVGALRQAVATGPSNGEWHNRLGLALARLGRLTDALDEFTRALELDPTNVSARQNAVLAHQRLGRD